MAEEKGHRVMVSLTPELYQKTLQVAEMMGLSESGAVRYLMMRGLENYMALIASTSSAEMLRGFMSIVEKEIEESAPSRRKKAKQESLGASVVPVTPRYSLKNETPGGKGGKKRHD